MKNVYRHGEKIRNWRYAWGLIPNPDYNPHLKFSKEYVGFFHDTRGEEFIYGYTGGKSYYGNVYRFRYDPLPGGGKCRKSHGSKCQNNGHGKGHPWKKAFVGDRLYQKEIFDEYGITFKMPDKIDHKYCTDNQRSWKRSKKHKQWV